jgi:hypothetical protein
MKTWLILSVFLLSVNAVYSQEEKIPDNHYGDSGGTVGI